MAFAFGQDTGFDLSGLLSNIVTVGGQIGTAAILKNQQSTTYPYAATSAINPATGLPYQYGTGLTTTTGGTSTMLLLGLAAVLGLVLFMRMAKKG